MLKKTITFTDFDGNSRTEDFYFHLNEAELTELNVSVEGGLAATLTKIVNENNQKRIWGYMKDIVVMAYGEKSADGRRFSKTQEIKDSFVETEAFSVLLMELSRDAKAASDFVNGIIPADLRKKVDALPNPNN